MERLVKVDRNGTKYFEDDCCPKCGGRGYIEEYDYVDGGICFKCGGTGKHTTTRKEYTPEYAEKLHERKVARNAEKNVKYFTDCGCAEDGSFWSVMGNTYPIKDELKAAGAKFNYVMGWHFPENNEDFVCKKFEKEAAFIINVDGRAYMLPESLVIKNAKDEYLAANKVENPSIYIGSVGDKIAVESTLKRVGSYETMYGECYVYSFEDERENVFVWKTGKLLDFEIGAKVMVKGTIKEHSEYRGVKQTVLTRCKVA